MDACMQGAPEKPGNTEQNIYGSRGLRLWAIPAILLTALIGFVISHPAASNWISGAVKAEFLGAERMPDEAPSQTVTPAAEVRTVKAY